MKKTLTALAVTLLAAAAAFADIHGAWTAESEGSGRLQMNITRHDNHFGQTMNAGDFTNLPPSAVDASGQTPVDFELRREAGTVAFEGTFRNGFGAGQFTFSPNPNYVSTLNSLGVKFDDGHEWTDSRLMEMALLDVSTSFIRSLQAEGYRETGKTYVEMRIFKVTPEFIRDLKDAGYEHVPAQKLIEMRIHGITPDYIKRMSSGSGIQ